MGSLNYDLTGRKILVVEDNDTSRYYYQVALTKSHANTLWAKNGIEALSLFEHNPDIDLVLMDLNMPEMDGYEATRLIKKLKPGIPVIVQSAFILSGEETKSYEAGCDEFLAKPVRLKLLMEAIGRYLK
ncbi:response regulator [Gaoshiqia sp. Z1-71]|uniref:response regulator n=1 Tax=Gaoshiqia hydrogeniformans TaxID=3290090 RepID=UPI003BF8A237